MRTLFIFTLLIITLTACEKTVPLELGAMQAKVAIEGQVTNRAGRQFVKITRAVDFYTNGKTPRVTNATVMVKDDLGNNFSYVHNPNSHPDSAGYYLPETPFTGVIGRTYILTVVVDGQTYEATDKIYSIAPIDKLEIGIDEDEQADPEDPGRFYELLYFITEPQATKDYYLLKCYRNGVLEYEEDSEVYYADDELIGENIEGAPIPIYYAANDMAKIEVYSLSREAFIFYRDLDKLLNNDGGMFDPPAATPRTNLSNDALGFFQACAIVTGEKLVEIE